jgi:universal stress protein A
MPPVRTILSPVDFSEASAHALRQARALALDTGAKLVLMHAVHDPVFAYTDGSGYLTPATIERYESDVKRRLDQVAAELDTPGLVVETLVERGTPPEAICGVAERIQADLIVIGTHGRSGLSRWLLGSVAERVLRAAQVPVLTVRAPLPHAEA